MTRAGFVAVVGAPNAGKSTLVNRLVGAKVSIVTQKVQTTRFPIRGVAQEGESQIVLVDTPGIFRPRRRLDRAMIRAAWDRLGEAEVVVHVVDAEAEISAQGSGGDAADRRAAEDARTIAEGLEAAGRSAILALNKIDQVRREVLLPLVERLSALGVYSEVFLISAQTGSGVDDLKRRLAELMPEGPWLYPADQTADLPVSLLAAEITREKVYLRVHEELPYAAGVETTLFEERKDGSVRLEQTIYVEREGQKAIMIGKAGATLKWIGAASRQELGEILGRTVHLFLSVKVKANWSEEPGAYRDLGLSFDV
jgi:GTP-binding protein Era